MLGFVVKWHRERRLRAGKLPKVRRIDKLPYAREGVFRLGVKDGGGELVWDPWGIDAPHLLVTGTTGGGKSRLMEMMALVALSWGWEVEIIDFKGGADYWAATARGAKVVSTPAESVAALKRAAKDIADRNRLMLQTPVRREADHDPNLTLDDRAVTFRDLPPEVRAEHDLKPRAMFVDETVSILLDKKAGGMDALQTGVQLARSAGVHLILSLQRPDANLLPGFIKHNVGARILFGEADQEAEQMVLGSAVGMLDDIQRLAPRPAGRGLAAGVGARPISRFQAFMLERDRYLPVHREPLRLVPSGPPGDGSGDAASGEPSGGSSSPDSSSSPDPGPPVGGAGSSSSPVRPRRLRLAFLARLRLRLGALRCLVGPVRSGPFDRDPALAERCKRDASWRCAACGGGPPVQADHRRPLWCGGADSMENLRALCVPCHAAVTRVQTKIRAWRRRRGALGRLTIPRPRWAWWQWAGVASLGAGFVDGRWAVMSVLVLVAFTIGPPYARYYLVPKPLRRRGGPGIDGRWTGDDQAEARIPGAAGAYVRGRNALIWKGVTFRVATIGIAGVYLLGVFLRSRF